MSKEDVTKDAPKVDEDEELAELLDSALEDFSKSPSKAPETKEGSGNDDLEEDAAEDVAWTDEFIKQAADQFESNISNILREVGGGEVSSDQVHQSFQRMAEAAAQSVVSSNTDLPNQDFTASISQALQSLSQGTENLQNPFSDQDLLGMFGQSQGEQNAFMPFMQGMMQSLLSKDVLYPSLKDILDKYPTWLEANGGSLPADERKKYEQQQVLMTQVCEQLEKEPDCDTPDKKKVQFEKVLELMQKLQDCGQPPTELVGDLGPGLPFNAQGAPDMNQCTVM